MPRGRTREGRLKAEDRSHFTALTATTVLGGATKHASGLQVVLPSSGHAWRHRRRLLMHFPAEGQESSAKEAALRNVFSALVG